MLVWFVGVLDVVAASAGAAAPDANMLTARMAAATDLENRRDLMELVLFPRGRVHGARVGDPLTGSPTT